MNSNVLYQLCLEQHHKEIGNKTTFSDTLDKQGKKYFNSKWLGVFPRDTFIKKLPLEKGKYAIVNVDKASQPGSHWLGVVTLGGNKIMLWDSFGREKISELFKQAKLTIPDMDKDQTISQIDCGQRALSWLNVYDMLGKKAAMSI